MGLFGGAKPVKPPAFYGEAARNSEAQYRKMLMFLGELEPHVGKAFKDLPEEWGQIRSTLSDLRGEYEAQNPWDTEFAQRGRELEQQTLREVGDAGSEWRQDEAAATAVEDFNTRYAQQERDAEINARNYGRAAPGIFGSSAAQRAAAGAAVANDARDRTRFRGEDVRRQFLPMASAYGDSVLSRLGQLGQVDAQDANLVSGLPSALSGVKSVYGDFLKDQVNPQQETAMRTNNILHQAKQRYADLKSARSGRMFSNLVSIGAAPFTGGASLAGLRVGGGADGTGASAPFAWSGGGSQFSNPLANGLPSWASGASNAFSRPAWAINMFGSSGTGGHTAQSNPGLNRNAFGEYGRGG